MNKTYYIDKDVPTSMTLLLQKLGWTHTNLIRHATLWIPQNYTTLSLQLANRTCHTPVTIGLNGCDRFISKERLFSQIYYPVFKSYYTRYLPPTLLFRPQIQDVPEHGTCPVYIAKKNIQRKEGIHLIRNQFDLLQIYPDDQYVVYQRYIMRPMLYNHHKINVRSYILITVQQSIKKVYRFSHAKCIYTTLPYQSDSLNQLAHITSLDLDHTIYNQCPYFWNDILCHHPILAERFYLAEKVAGKLMQRQLYHRGSGIGLQYFGLDWIIDMDVDYGRPLLLEINKGPDMYPKFESEREYKEAVLKGVLAITGLETMHPLYHWQHIE